MSITKEILTKEINGKLRTTHIVGIFCADPFRKVSSFVTPCPSCVRPAKGKGKGKAVR